MVGKHRAIFRFTIATSLRLNSKKTKMVWSSLLSENISSLVFETQPKQIKQSKMEIDHELGPAQFQLVYNYCLQVLITPIV